MYVTYSTSDFFLYINTENITTLVIVSLLELYSFFRLLKKRTLFGYGLYNHIKPLGTWSVSAH